MNGGQNTLVRWIVTIVLAAIALQLAVAAIAPLVPYILGVLAIGALVVLARWWRDRW